MTFQVVWSADKHVEAVRRWLDSYGLLLEASRVGLRAVSYPCPTAEGLLGELLKSGFRVSGPTLRKSGKAVRGGRPGGCEGMR